MSEDAPVRYELQLIEDLLALEHQVVETKRSVSALALLRDPPAFAGRFRPPPRWR